MNMNEPVILNATVLTELYGKDFLIDGSSSENSLKKFSKRKLAVVTGHPHQIPQHVNAFLQSILTACKLRSDEVVTTTASSASITYDAIQQTWGNSATLLFGVEPEAIGLPMHFPHFQLQTFGECTYLSSPPLEEIEKDRSLKLQLWQSLQKIFPV